MSDKLKTQGKLDVDGDKRLLYEDGGMGCYNPIPLRPTPRPQVLAGSGETGDSAWGTYLLADVYRGLDQELAAVFYCPVNSHRHLTLPRAVMAERKLQLADGLIT